MKKQTVFFFTIIGILFYGSLCLMGVRECADTPTYRTMEPYREPLYGILLNLSSRLFHENGDWVIAFLQNTLAVITCGLITLYVVRKLEIRNCLLQLLVMSIVVAPYLMVPFFTSSRMIVTNVLMTEGVTFSLYNLIVLLFLQLMWEREMTIRKNWMLHIGIWSLLLVTTLIRSQLQVMIIVWVIVEVFLWGTRRKGKKDVHLIRQLLLVIGSVFLLVFVRKGIVGLVNQNVYGISGQTTYANTTLFTNVLFVADRSTGEYIEEQEIRTLFYEIYDACEEDQLLKKQEPDDFAEAVDFHFMAHDTIKLEIMQSKLNEYIWDKYTNLNNYEHYRKMDEITGKMLKPVFMHSMPEWMGYYFRNVLVGLIRSVAILNKWLYLPVAIGYGVLVALAIMICKNPDQKVLQLFLLTALMTAGTVSSVSLVIMCLSRYMIYNMSWIYLSGVLMLIQVIQGKKRSIKEE